MNVEDTVYLKDVDFIHLNFELQEIEDHDLDEDKDFEQLFVIVLSVLTIASCLGLFWIQNRNQLGI